MNKNPTTIRLILGDQLNHEHSWFSQKDDTVLYVLMEMRQETDYVAHHIQKVVAFFAGMRQFAKHLKEQGHQVHYIQLDDKNNLQNIPDNITQLIKKYKASHFEWQLPDEYRLDVQLNELSQHLNKEFKTTCQSIDSEHFMSNRTELGEFFKGKKQYLLERFYRHMRTKHNVLMDGKKPLTGQWNYDKENRKKLPANHVPIAPLVFENEVEDIIKIIQKSDIKTIGNIDKKGFVWPVTRAQSLELLEFFAQDCLPVFGSFQDAMTPHAWSLYHSRISFSMNVKLISPLEVINRAIQEWEARTDEIGFNQLEGFVRQIIGWREFIRGMYESRGSDERTRNFWGFTKKIPKSFYDGTTGIYPIDQTIKKTLETGYCHHIERLMVLGNFMLLCEFDPDEVYRWFMELFIDSYDWVMVPNVYGMSQFADGGVVASKPYVSSAAYIHKMSHYCKTCYYDKSVKTGPKACPFNSLYWNFYDRHQDKLGKNPRIGMMYRIWEKMDSGKRVDLLEQAKIYLEDIENL